MNRPILFRGKQALTEEWVEGLLTVMWGQYHIILPEDENTAYPVDPETVIDALTEFAESKGWLLGGRWGPVDMDNPDGDLP